MIEPIRDRFGLISPTGEVNQNGVLWTAYYSAALNHISLTSKLAVESCLWGVPVIGLRRTPKSAEIESHDNHVGLGYLLSKSSLMDMQKGARYILWLSRHHWLMNDISTPRPWHKRWLQRFPHVVPHLKWSVGMEPNWLEKALWFASIWVQCKQAKKGDNGILMVYLMLQTHPNSYLEKVMKKQVEKVHGSFASCIQDYMQLQEDHFMVQAFKLVD